MNGVEQGRIGRGARLALLLALLGSGTSAAAQPTERAPGVWAVLDGVRPALPGVSIKVRPTTGPQLVVSNPTPTELTVLADAGEPFLRIGPRGVLANLNAPSWYQSNAPHRARSIPEQARTPGAEPAWAEVAREPSWAWFEHRLSPTGVGVVAPEAVKGRKTVRLADWSVPMRYGERPVEILGHTEYRPVEGRFAFALTSPAAPVEGVRVALTPTPRVPGLLLENSSGEPVTVLGADGEPFARIGPGAEVNLRSPTYVQNLQAEGESPTVPADAKAEPEWRKVSEDTRYSWLEFRAAYPEADPPREALRRSEPATLVNWTVPVMIGTRRTDVTGVTRFVPLPLEDQSTDERSGGGVAAFLGAAAAAVGLALVFTRRRRRRRRSSGRRGGRRRASGRASGRRATRARRH